MIAKLLKTLSEKVTLKVTFLVTLKVTFLVTLKVTAKMHIKLHIKIIDRFIPLGMLRGFLGLALSLHGMVGKAERFGAPI